MDGINGYAIVVAALASFLLGGPWYSQAMFGAIWHREAADGGPAQSHHPARVFAVSFLFALIAATAFACWLGPRPPLNFTLGRGLLAGAGMVASSFGINCQFANRSTLMWLVDGGYPTVQFALFGLVLGLWHQTPG
ncbi:MAG: DUF1761 domain-containing protein [Tahibacter sp.]